MKRTMTVTILSSCAVLLVLVACGGGSPEEQAERWRGMYSARLNTSQYGSFIIQWPEPAPEPTMEEGAEPPAEEAEEAEMPEGEGEAAEAEEPPPAGNPNIMLDILIQHDSPIKLPGVTVDITMADADGNEKGAWKVWFDTADLPKANVRSYTHVLEDVPWEEGLGFHAEVRHPVPVEERGEYKELSSAG